MKKSELIKKLETIIETIKDDNNYIVNVWEKEGTDIEKVTVESDEGSQVVGLKEVGKDIDIDISIEYVNHKMIELEDE